MASTFTHFLLGLLLATPSMTANAQTASEPDAFATCNQTCSQEPAYSANVYIGESKTKYDKGRKGYLCGCAHSYGIAVQICIEKTPAPNGGHHNNKIDKKFCASSDTQKVITVPFKDERKVCQTTCGGAGKIRLIAELENKEMVCGCNDAAKSCHKLTAGGSSSINDPYLDNASCKIIAPKKPSEVAKLDAEVEKLKKPDEKLEHDLLVANKRKEQAERALANLKPGEDPTSANNELTQAEIEIDVFRQKNLAREKLLASAEANRRAEIAKQFNALDGKADADSLAKKAALKDAIKEDNTLTKMLADSGGQKFNDASMKTLEDTRKDASAEATLASRMADKAMENGVEAGVVAPAGAAATASTGQVDEGLEGKLAQRPQIPPDFDKDKDKILNPDERAERDKYNQEQATQNGGVAAGNGQNGAPGTGGGKQTILVNDSCRGTILNELAEEMKHDPAFKNTRQTKKDINDWIADHQDRADALKQKYGCDADIKSISSLDEFNNYAQAGLAVASGVAAGVATGNVQREFEEKQGDSAAVNRKAFQEMGSAMETTGYVQLGVGALQMVMSEKGRRVENRQDEAAARLQMMKENRTGIEDAEGNKLKNKGLGAHMVSEDENLDIKELNKEGNQMSEAAAQSHERAKTQANAFKQKTFFSSLIQLATGASNISQGRQYKDMANMFTDPAAANPTGELAPGEAGGDVENSPPPAVVGGSGTVDSGELAQTSVEDLDEKRKGGVGPTGPLIGGRASGGLKDGQKFGGQGGGVGFGPQGTVGGGGVGGGVSASGSGGGGPDKPSSANEVVGGGSGKFESGGSGTGGPTFGGGGAGGARNTGGGSDMDINGLLAQLMPKPGEEHGAGGPNILGRGLASSEGGDGGVLGKNANLFHRISGTTMNYYKKGNLK